MPLRVVTPDSLQIITEWVRPRLNILMAFCIVLGIATRTAQYFSRQSYWHDEAFLVMNVEHKSARQLLTAPLDYDQAAPPVFLLLERAATKLFGTSEFSLRLAPLLLSLTSVVLFTGLARKLLPPLPAVFAAALFALSDKLIWHAAETKQYSGDVCCACLLLYLFLVPPRPQSRVTRLFLLSAVAACAIWLSHPALFIFFGISLAVLPRFWRSARAFACYLLANLSVVLSFALLYRFSIRLQHNPALDLFWGHDFFPWRKPLQIPWWLASHTVDLFDHPYYPVGVVLLGLALIAVATSRPHPVPRLRLVLTMPIVLTLAAAAVRQYPYAGSRLTLFLVPCMLLLAALGLHQLVVAAPLRLRPWLCAPAALPLLAVSLLAAYHLAYPRYDSNIRPIADYVALNYHPGDAIYALDSTGLDSQRAYEFQCYWHNPAPVKNELPANSDAIPPGRFWITYASQPSTGSKKIEPLIRQLRGSATLLNQLQTPGGSAYLFEKDPTTRTAPAQAGR